MKATTTGQTGRGWQLVAAVAMALMLALTLIGSVDAAGKKPVSQAQRIENTRDMCESLGGSFEVSDGPFEGIKYSKCTGGEYDGYTCAHGKTKSNCSYQIQTQPKDQFQIDPTLTTGQTFEVQTGSSSGTVVLEPTDADQPSR